LAQFFNNDTKISYEQFLEVDYCRLCRLEMGRRMSWRYRCVLYCVLVTWLCELLKLLNFFLIP